jgi:hypothetical protein
MTREGHVRFCEGGRVRFPSATRPVICFQYREEAESVLQVRPKRFARYGLTLQPEKRRLVEFGRAALARARSSQYSLSRSARMLTKRTSRLPSSSISSCTVGERPYSMAGGAERADVASRFLD